jgi:hypothetical protein
LTAKESQDAVSIRDTLAAYRAETGRRLAAVALVVDPLVRARPSAPAQLRLPALHRSAPAAGVFILNTFAQLSQRHRRRILFVFAMSFFARPLMRSKPISYLQRPAYACQPMPGPSLKKCRYVLC